MQKTNDAFTEKMKAAWQKMSGAALLGFLAFASGLTLLAEGLKRDIAGQLRQESHNN